MARPVLGSETLSSFRETLHLPSFSSPQPGVGIPLQIFAFSSPGRPLPRPPLSSSQAPASLLLWELPYAGSKADRGETTRLLLV